MDGDVTDAGLGEDDGTLTGHAYNCGWGSQWSRDVELVAAAGDNITHVPNPNVGGNTTIIVKAA